MAGTKKKYRCEDAAHRLLVKLGVMNQDGHIRNEPRILYTKKLMVFELQNMGWKWSPELGWIKEYDNATRLPDKGTDKTQELPTV